MVTDSSPAMAGLVLAGGRGRRMGRDKAGIETSGRSLLERAATALETVCTRVYIASGDGRRLPGCRWTQVADVERAAGPLAGIVAGMERVSEPLLAVVAVDMPFANPGVLALLRAAWRGEPAVLPSVDGRVEPLHATYATAAAERFRAALVAGQRSPAEAARQLGARIVEPAEWHAADPTGRFAVNVNRPDDLAVLLES